MCIHVYLHHTAYLLLLLYNEVVKGPFLSFSLLIKSKGPLHHHHLNTLFKTLNAYMGFRVFFQIFAFFFLGGQLVCPSSQKRRHLTTRRHGNHRRVRQRQVRGRRAGVYDVNDAFFVGRRLVLLGCCRFCFASSLLFVGLLLSSFF